jgi:hypothetical protein
MKALLTIALLPAALIPQAPSQTNRDVTRPPMTGTASITGVVTADDASGLPVRRAVVTVSGSGASSPGRLAFTDDHGRFAATDLPEGRYYLTVNKNGWTPLAYGAAGPNEGGMPIVLADGAHVTLDLKLTRGAVIAGRVIDEHGAPQALKQLALLEYRTIGGQRQLQNAPIVSAQFFRTNDLGEYRMYGLPAGSYVVALRPSILVATTRATSDDEVRWALQLTASPVPASRTANAPPPGQTVTFAAVYYPGVTDASAAATIAVAAGEERLGIDFVVALVPSAQLRGVITRPDGQPASGASLLIGRSQATTSPLDTSVSFSTTADAKGAFAFRSMAPGNYLISARASSPQSGAAAASPGARPATPTLDLWSMAEVAISGRDIDDLSLVLQPGLRVSGRLAFEIAPGTPAPNPSAVRVVMSSPLLASVAQGGSVGLGASVSTFLGAANADGTFSFPGVVPGRYVLTAAGGGPISSLMVKNVMIGGRNVHEGFEVRAGEDLTDVVLTLTDQTGEITGTLLDPAGKPAPEFYVFAFPTDKKQWTPGSPRMRQPVRPGTDGKFQITKMLGGEYYVAALSRFDPSNLYDTDFLEQVAASAFKLTLADGEKKIQNLRVAR